MFGAKNNYPTHRLYFGEVETNYWGMVASRLSAKESLVTIDI